jgi:ring-1,2-phenylacetyl-CoA epoxidase subunit PaaD
MENKSPSTVWKKLETIQDPEIPVLSLVDLGIIRDIKIRNEKVYAIITPTYSGCPAMQLMEDNIRSALLAMGFSEVNIEIQLVPAWTTDWISEKGKEKLREFGIAPPTRVTEKDLPLFQIQDPVPCPRCNSKNTFEVSRFGSTPCKALHSCSDCLEPFDYFKHI